MLYCAHNKESDAHLVVMADSINEAGEIASDYWIDEKKYVVVTSLEQFVREHNGVVEII